MTDMPLIAQEHLDRAIDTLESAERDHVVDDGTAAVAHGVIAIALMLSELLADRDG